MKTDLIFVNAHQPVPCEVVHVIVDVNNAIQEFENIENKFRKKNILIHKHLAWTFLFVGKKI